MRHQAQKDFRGILVVIPQHQKGYIVCVPGTRKMVSSYDVIFDEFFLLRQHIRQNHTQRQRICIQMCHTNLMLNLQGNKMAI